MKQQLSHVSFARQTGEPTDREIRDMIDTVIFQALGPVALDVAETAVSAGGRLGRCPCHDERRPRSPSGRIKAIESGRQHL